MSEKEKAAGKPDNIQEKIKKATERLETKVEWEPISTPNSEGGIMERASIHSGWLVRYRNKPPRIMSPSIVILDEDHEWKIKELRNGDDWDTITPSDHEDRSWGQKFPVYKGWFLGIGNSHKTIFTDVHYIYDSENKWK